MFRSILFATLIALTSNLLPGTASAQGPDARAVINPYFLVGAIARGDPVTPEGRCDLREIAPEERLPSCERYPKERAHARAGVCQGADLAEARSVSPRRHVLPVEAVSTAEVAAPRDEERQMNRRALGAESTP